MMKELRDTIVMKTTEQLIDITSIDKLVNYIEFSKLIDAIMKETVEGAIYKYKPHTHNRHIQLLT